MSEYLDLYDFRCRVAALYRERALATARGEDAEAILTRFRAGRDAIFARHPQSALDEEQKRAFQGLPYFPYNRAMRFVVEVDTSVEAKQQSVATNSGESMTMTTAGLLHFSVGDQPVTLSLFWLNIYGGGLFLPFRDTTSPAESYGGGRYLFDTIKGSDPLPVPGKSGWQHMTLDFNYAYNPSCAYNDRWVCPLAPIENRLRVAIRAGELRFR
jgi:uncharacterized protein (DUF1684 family)